MADNMGGSFTAKVPAWKLRRQQHRLNNKQSSLQRNDELGGSRFHARRPRGDNELDRKRDGSSAIPAWKLRERYKTEGGSNLDDNSSVVSSDSTRSTYSRSSVPSQGSRKIRPVSRVPEDPSLPPAFRAAARQQRRKNPDDFFSLSSVHSRSRTDACSTANSFGSDSFEFLDSDDNDSFDGENSFASLDSDADEDDDAYRESRNQMARLKIEKQKQSQDAKRVGVSRFKKKTTGVHGTPLDFIAE